MLLNSGRAQSPYPSLCPIAEAAAMMAAADIDARGAVFTRREVVDLILNLVGYTADRPLHEARLLEPAMGQGDFLIPAIERLFEAYERDIPAHKRNIVRDLADCIRAVELHHASYRQTRSLVMAALVSKGLSVFDIHALCDSWLLQGDFLLLRLAGTFTHVIGNPPYVRQEFIPDVLIAEYRRRFTTVYDRADLYIPFMERSLSLLEPDGCLGFICADRWMKNRYGGPLRRFVAEGFHLGYCVDMVDTKAFLSDVIAYPAIVVISREKPGPTRVACRPAINTRTLTALARSMTAPRLKKGKGITEVEGVTNGSEPWMLETQGVLGVIRRLEAEFPALEEAGCKVGIGVATGADQVFIGPLGELDVEPDRKLPLAMTRDIASGVVKWRGLGVINPFGADGKLVPLTDYPKLAAHLERHGAAIKARHVSKKNPNGWYRTIDRIYPELTHKPKLLIPDINGSAQVVYEPGELYPHHNLYFVTADEWALRALQAVLLSDVARAFIGLYSTKMRGGGYLRFQAQYLRRIRIPHWDEVPNPLRVALTRAGTTRDAAACNKAVAELYQLTAPEQQALAVMTGITNAA